MLLTFAIVQVVFADTSGKIIDRRIPHRNDILHRGILEYSDEEIDMAYKNLLVYYCIIDELCSVR